MGRGSSLIVCFQEYTDGTKNASLASFAKEVGLIGRARESGFEVSSNVQKLSADQFLRLKLAQDSGVKGTAAVYVAKFEAVVEFYTGEERSDFDKEGILACF